MKKKLLSLLCVTSIIVVYWIFHAIKFERDVTEIYLPMLKQSKINIDYDAVVVDKFSFKVSLKNPKIYIKGQELFFTGDILVIRQAPLTKKIYIDSYGGQDNLNVPKNSLYAPNHHIAIVISKPWLSNDPNTLNLNIENNKFSLFDSNTNMQLLELQQYNLSLQHAESGTDNYTLKLDSQSINVRLGDVFTEFMSQEFFKLLPEFQVVANIAHKSSEDYYYFLTKLDEIIGGTDENSRVSLTYPKNFLSKILAFNLTNGYALVKFLTDDIFPENFDLHVQGVRTNKFVEGKFNLDFHNNESSKLECDINQDYNSNHLRNSELIEFAADYLQKVVNRDLNKLFSDEKGPLVFSHEDLVKLLAPFKDVRNIKMSGLFEYPRAAGTASHLLEVRVNNFAFKFKGSESGNDYNSEFNIANFPNLVKFVGKYNDEAIQPIVKKAEGQETLVRLQKIINTVDQYGPSALSALNANAKEQNQSNFLMKFKRGNSLSSLQINNIEWSQILMDERIQTFLKNLMPLNEPKAN
jgi:hypothetical protein